MISGDFAACPRELDSQITDILTGLVFGGEGLIKSYL